MSLRAAAHFGSAFVLLSIYGGQICPFLESLSLIQVGAPIAVVLTAAGLLRKPLHTRFIDRASLAAQSRSAFALDWGLFAVAGIVLTVFNSVIHGFPAGSGLKLSLGLITLGLFAAVDLSLERERSLVARFQRTGEQMTITERHVPVSTKLGLFATLTVIFTMTVLFLVMSKDLDWLTHPEQTLPIEQAQRAILMEFLFVAAVMLAHLLNATMSYARNLTLFFRNQNGVLSAATSGRLDGRVPVSSNDDFGVMASYTNQMIASLRDQNTLLQRTQDVTILTLASLAETRDNETGAHILRTQRYVRALAMRLRDHPRFRAALSDEAIDLMYKSAPLHDVGKVGIPDAILLKPGKLTEEEWAVMRTHPEIGASALQAAEEALGGNSFLRYAREIALTHHEKWDGSGYPAGLAGEAIPVSGRLMALADVYDALTTQRVYKPAWSHEQAARTVREGAGSHFDPAVVAAFTAAEEEFRSIAREFSDAQHQAEAALAAERQDSCEGRREGQARGHEALA
jgi:HD-GYP domain-containing protein (c-di-GMP phosphodiesterase class II)